MSSQAKCRCVRTENGRQLQQERKGEIYGSVIALNDRSSRLCVN
jgi:hypothetical protein